MDGWIKLYRQILKKAIWTSSTPEQKTILITLLLMANHQTQEWEWMGKKYIVKPGEFITSLKKIKKMCGKGITIKRIRTALLKFENYGFLASKTTNKNRLISVINWDIYQGREEKRASNGQATGKQRATNKNIKNIKNIYTADFKKSASSPKKKKAEAQRCEVDFCKQKVMKDKNTCKIHTAMNCEEFVRWCGESKQEHVKIIGEWAETVNPKFKTVAQWEEYLRRNLRAARRLIPFSREQLDEGFGRIEKGIREGWLTEYGLETLYKMITNDKK